MAKANLTKAANIDTHAREIDFVTRFANNWQHLQDIMGITRDVQKAPGNDCLPDSTTPSRAERHRRRGRNR